MKQGWLTTTLGEVCEKSSSNVSQNQLENDNGAYPIYGASGFIKNVGFYHQKKEYVSIVKDGAGIGRIALLPPHSSVIGTLQYLIPKDILDIRYFYYFLSKIDFWKYKNGSTIPHIYFKDYSVESILVPPLPEQQRIVSILDEAFAAIAKAKANTEQNLKNAKELFESYLQSVFENKINIWEETTLRDNVNLLTGFPFKSKRYSQNEKDILLLRGDNIMQGYIRWDDAKRWSKNEFADYEKYQLQKNDILLAMDRPWVKAGLKCATVTEQDLPSLLVQRTARLRSDRNLDSSYLFYLIKSRAFTQHLLGAQKGIGVPHISAQQILDFQFCRPQIMEQQRLVQKLDCLSAQSKKLESIYQQKINSLEELKKSILQKAFNGELKTSEPVPA